MFMRDCTSHFSSHAVCQGGDAYQSVVAALNHAAVAVTRTLGPFVIYRAYWSFVWRGLNSESRIQASTILNSTS